MEYKKKYFDWQKDIGFFGGVANKFKFEEYINKNSIVVDFGSGGGYLLSNIDCKEKIGVEINDVARKEASRQGIKVVKKIEELKNNYADVIISNHALEHVECPVQILKDLKEKLKQKGKIVFVVPHQNAKERYFENDVNQHIYTWNPLTLGNLFKAAGYKNIKVTLIRHKWPPKYNLIYKLFGLKLFNAVCKFYAFFKRNYQIKIEATR